jgi:hypothetical protein
MQIIRAVNLYREQRFCIKMSPFRPALSPERMTNPFSFDVFLSHNTKDKPRVRRLAERLRAAAVHVWLDEWIIKPGDDIYLAVERGLQAARVQVLCMSPDALGSDWVGLERSTVLFRDPRNVGRIPPKGAFCGKIEIYYRRHRMVCHGRTNHIGCSACGSRR